MCRPNAPLRAGGSKGRRYARMCRSLWHGHPGHDGNGRDALATFRFSRPFATKTPRHQVGLLTRHTGTQPVGRNQLSSRYFVLSWWENPRGAWRRQDASTENDYSLLWKNVKDYLSLRAINCSPQGEENSPPAHKRRGGWCMSSTG